MAQTSDWLLKRSGRTSQDALPDCFLDETSSGEASSIGWFGMEW